MSDPITQQSNAFEPLVQLFATEPCVWKRFEKMPLPQVDGVFGSCEADPKTESQLGDHSPWRDWFCFRQQASSRIVQLFQLSGPPWHSVVPILSAKSFCQCLVHGIA